MTDEERRKIFAEDRGLFRRYKLYGTDLEQLLLTDATVLGMWVSCRATGHTIEETLIKCLIMSATGYKKLLEAEIDRLWRNPPPVVIPLYSRIEPGRDDGGWKGAEDVSV